MYMNFENLYIIMPKKELIIFPNMDNYILSYSIYNQIHKQRYRSFDIFYRELSPEYGELYYLILIVFRENAI